MSGTSSDSYIDVHVDKKPCLRPTTLANVPEEILVRIFANVDAIQVARIQLVSRQWSRIIRSTPAVWRNALYLDYGIRKPSLPRLFSRLLKLANLSDRKLDKVGLSFGPLSACCTCCSCGECQSAERTSQWIFEALRGIRVRMLYVFLNERAWKKRNGYRNIVFQGLEQLFHTGYESLVISYRRPTEECHCSDCVDTDDEGEDRVSFLLDAVGLSDDVTHRLYLDRVTFLGGLEPSSRLFANLTGLYLESLRFDRKEDVLAFWTLLEAMQDTLYELFLNLTPSAAPFGTRLGSESNVPTTLTFTKLVRFHLGYYGDNKLSGPQLYTFSCPMLESLSLNCLTSDVLFDGLLTPAVKNVRVTCKSLEYEENVKALIGHQGLQKLFIDTESVFDFNIQHRVLMCALRISPPTLILLLDEDSAKSNILSFVKLVEGIYPTLPKAPQVGFCYVARDHTRRQAQLDDLRKSVLNADKFVWMENARPYLAMHEQEWGDYDVRSEL